MCNLIYDRDGKVIGSYMPMPDKGSALWKLFMGHDKDCKCSECCYPQRTAPPKSKAENPTVQSGRGPAAAKKQVGTAGEN